MMTRTCVKARMALLALLLLSGCSHSRVIQVNVINASPDKISNIVIDYPSATFGIRSLDAGKTFPYVIKVTENGVVKIEFADAQGRTKRFSGPDVRKDDEGNMEIRLTQDAAVAEAKLRNH
jgi:hypothetical protein